MARRAMAVDNRSNLPVERYGGALRRHEEDRHDPGFTHSAPARRASADLPCASNPSISANFRTVASDFLSATRSYSTTLVRRWNWSTVRPANEAPAPPVGNSWLGPAT